MDLELFPKREAQNMLALADPSSVAAAEAAKARIQAAYIMAYQKPREEAVSRDRILHACKRTEFASKAEYSKPIGKGKELTGPSIRFAELALREWGNVMSEVQTLYEDDKIRRCRVSVLDLETNTQFTKDLQIKKTVERKSKKGRENDVLGERKNTYGDTVYILQATDEEMYTKEAAWVSKVLRNEGLRLIPTDIIEEGMRTARKTVAAHVAQDPDSEKKKVLDAFSSIGVRPQDIEGHLNHSLGIISTKEIVALRKIYQSIRDGEASWNDYALPEKDKSPVEADKGLLAVAKRNDLDPAKLEKFVEKLAEKYKATREEIISQAAENEEDFVNQVRIFIDGQNKTSNIGIPKTISGEIAGLKTPGLTAWEKENHDDILDMQPEDRKFFLGKWKRTMKADYFAEGQPGHDAGTSTAEEIETDIQDPQIENDTTPANTTKNFEFLNTMKGLKAQIEKLDGNHESYYGFLGLMGYEKSNQISDRAHQKEIWEILTDYIKKKE